MPTEETFISNFITQLKTHLTKTNYYDSLEYELRAMDWFKIWRQNCDVHDTWALKAYLQKNKIISISTTKFTLHIQDKYTKEFHFDNHPELCFSATCCN